MALSVHLLGLPRAERDGAVVAAPRGHKAWGLLTYLLRTEVAPSRERLAELLFPDADDPLGSVRWTLSALRRTLGADVSLRGDPVELALPPGTVVDLDVLGRGAWVEAVALRGFGRELLEGLVLRASAGFEIWLENERRHVAGTTAAARHAAAHALLARGEPGAAADHAAELVRLSPYEENVHVLLVRCLREAGEREAAERQVEASTELFRRELGREPGPALAAAAREPVRRALPAGSGRAAVQAQLEAGEAAIAAGAADAGIDRLRGAVAAARAAGDDALLARALVGVGGALVHSARGTDEEGATALHEGSALAERTANFELAAKAWCEIAWIEFLRSHYERAETCLDRVGELGPRDVELAWADVIRGSCRSDRGDHVAARELLLRGAERADAAGSAHAGAFARSMLGRLHILRGELDEARPVLEDALALVDRSGLVSFRSWPQSFLAEAQLLQGDLDAAEENFERAFALGCEVGDPCWESIGARGLGLVAAARGDLAGALELLVEAPKLCRRLPDTYLWIESYSWDALCAVGLDHGAESTALWIDRLEATTARRGQRELLARAAVYRARLGEPGALLAAESIAADIDNPALHERIAALRSDAVPA